MAGCALFLQIIEGKAQAHFIMDDPAGNSYLQVQPWALRVGSQGTLGGFISLACVGSGAPIGAVAMSRLQKALLTLWVLSWAAAHGPQPVLVAGPVGRGECRSFPPSPQNVYAPEEDPELSVQRYERTFEQNEELGLNDMKTEGYEPEMASGR